MLQRVRWLAGEACAIIMIAPIIQNYHKPPLWHDDTFSEKGELRRLEALRSQPLFETLKVYPFVKAQGQNSGGRMNEAASSCQCSLRGMEVASAQESQREGQGPTHTRERKCACV